MHLVLGEFGYR